MCEESKTYADYVLLAVLALYGFHDDHVKTPEYLTALVHPQLVPETVNKESNRLFEHSSVYLPCSLKNLCLIF